MCAETHETWLEDHRYLNMKSNTSAMTFFLHNLTYTTVDRNSRSSSDYNIT